MTEISRQGSCSNVVFLDVDGLMRISRALVLDFHNRRTAPFKKHHLAVNCSPELPDAERKHFDLDFGQAVAQIVSSCALICLFRMFLGTLNISGSLQRRLGTF
jgi:hypothetical protein